MDLKNVFLNFLIEEKNSTASRLVYKNALFRGLISLTILLIGLFYVFLYWNHRTGNIYLYFIIVVVAIVAFYLNRTGKYLLSNLSLALMVNFVVFYSAINTKINVSIFFFFLSNGVGVVALFGYGKRKYSLICSVITFILFLIAYRERFALVTFDSPTPELSKLYFAINFSVAYVASIGIVFFLIRTNFESESILKSNEKSLLAIAQELTESRQRYETVVRGDRTGVPEEARDLRDFKKRFRKLSDNRASLSTVEWEAIMKIVTPKSLAKNEFFVKEGEFCLDLALINSGMVRHFHREHDEEITNWISLPGTFFTSFQSFTTGQPSNENIQALEHTELYLIPRAQLQKLCEELPAVMELWVTYVESEYLHLKERLHHFISKTAEERYDFLCQQYPELIQQVPQKYIASMLGMELRTLSRIRKSLYSKLQR